MNIQNLFDRLAAFEHSLPQLVAFIKPEDARWKPADGAWSVLEIVRHLADEEAEDFRVRVQLTLEDPAQPWPAIDPEAAAIERHYNEGTLADAVAQFMGERQRSLDWLRPRITEIARQADQTYDHPGFGKIRLGELVAAWVAHDQLHVRQIAKRLYQLTQRDAGPYSLRYAGNW